MEMLLRLVAVEAVVETFLYLISLVSCGCYSLWFADVDVGTVLCACCSFHVRGTCWQSDGAT